MKGILVLLYLLLTLALIVIGTARRKRREKAQAPSPFPREAKPAEAEKPIEQPERAGEVKGTPEAVEEVEEVRPAARPRPIRIAGFELTPKTMLQAIIVGEVLRRKLE